MHSPEVSVEVQNLLQMREARGDRVEGEVGRRATTSESSLVGLGGGPSSPSARLWPPSTAREKEEGVHLLRALVQPYSKLIPSI